MDQTHELIDAAAPVGFVAALLNVAALLHPIVTAISVVYMLLYIAVHVRALLRKTPPQG